MDALGVPLHAQADKEDLARPMQRGIYAFSSPNQKTVLKLRVFAKEEAGFEPESLLRSPLAVNLEPEVLDRIRSTWTILQLTFEAYDPALYPALELMLRLASRLAELTEGVIADPLSVAYRLPADVPSHDSGELFAVTDFVTVQQNLGTGSWELQTTGLVKFDQPEILLAMVPDPQVTTGKSFLLSLADGVLRGKTLRPGDRLVSEQGWIVGESPTVTAQMVMAPCLEILPVRSSVAEALSAWKASHEQ